MANNDYIIKYSDKIKTIVVKENMIDRDKIPLSLIGHGQSNYGEDQNANFLHLLENFASDGSNNAPAPQHPVVGQLWYKDKGSGKFDLNVCSALDNSGNPTWTQLLQNITSASGSYPTGTLYYDTTSKKLKVWDESAGSSGDWISVGPNDIVHTEHIFKSILVSQNQSTASYIFNNTDMKIFDEIKETADPATEGNGSLNLVKMVIMAKEFKKNGTIPYSSAKSCVWIYKFVVRNLKTSSGSLIEIIGAPTYELLAETPADTLNWKVNIEMDSSTGSPHLSIKFNLTPSSTNNISIGMDCEVTRI